MMRVRWFGFAAVVACASVSLMGCGEGASGPSNNGRPPSNAPADGSYIPDDPIYLPGDYEPEEKPCGAGGPAEVC
jgi:hypothetical protein